MKTLLILFLAFSPIPAFARIGETVAQCRERYGKENKASEETKTLWFKKGDFLIGINFMEGKASTLMISRLKDRNGLNFELTSRQIEALLKSNGGESPWKKTAENLGGAVKWATSDGKILAFSNEKEGSLTIITAAQREQNGNARDKAEAAEIQGF